jgi:DNA-binding NtrC family response regulator
MTSTEGSLFAQTTRMSFRDDLFYRLSVMHLVLPRLFPRLERPRTRLDETSARDPAPMT